MKQFVKLLSFTLAVLLVFSLFASCGKKGNIIAVYDDIPVYESDVQDLMNYNLICYFDTAFTDDDINELMKDSVKTYVRYKAMEIDLAALGFEIDENELKELVSERIESLEKGMGYREWRESYRVSKDFIEEDTRRYLLAQLYAEVMQSDIKVTEKEAKEYYRLHALDEFAKYAGYHWTALLRPVRNIQDAEENAAAKQEMDDYLAKIKNGTLTVEQVQKELESKYNQNTGYPNSMYAGKDFTSADSIVIIETEEDLRKILADIDTEYADRNLDADTKSKEYQAYMNYIGYVFQTNTFYALQHMEPGEVWGNTLQSFVGYYIICLDDVELKNDFIPYEEVSGTIIETLMAKKMEEDFSSYILGLDEKYEISYIFDFTA